MIEQLIIAIMPTFSVNRASGNLARDAACRQKQYARANGLPITREDNPNSPDNTPPRNFIFH